MKDLGGTIFFAIVIGASFYTGKSVAEQKPCTIIYPDTCAVCRYHIDTTKDNRTRICSRFVSAGCTGKTLYNMRTNRNKYPLRKVVKRIIGEHKVELECGHIVNPSSDMYGETHPIRQRCRLCYQEVKAK